MGNSLFRQSVSGDSVPGRIRYYYYRYWRDKPESRVSADFVTLLTFFSSLDVGGGEFHTDDRCAGNAPAFDHDGAAANLDAPEHFPLAPGHTLHQRLVIGIAVRAHERSPLLPRLEFLIVILTLDILIEVAWIRPLRTIGCRPAVELDLVHFQPGVRLLFRRHPARQPIWSFHSARK